MADGVNVTEGAGVVIAADEIAGMKHQRVKLSIGADGEAQDLDSGQQACADSVPVVPASDIPDGTYIGDVRFGEALPAGTSLIGQVAAVGETGTIYNGTTALTPKFAAISGATNGNNTLVAAVADKKLRVVALMLMSAGTVTVTLQSGAGGAALTGALALTAQTGFCLPYNPVGWVETAAGALLNMALNAAVQVSGCLVYVEV